MNCSDLGFLEANRDTSTMNKTNTDSTCVPIASVSTDTSAMNKINTETTQTPIESVSVEEKSVIKKKKKKVRPKKPQVAQVSNTVMAGIRYNSQSETYTCSLCCRADFPEHNFHSHLEKHISAMPYQCKFCSYTCDTVSLMAQHFNELHPNSIVLFDLRITSLTSELIRKAKQNPFKIQFFKPVRYDVFSDKMLAVPVSQNSSPFVAASYPAVSEVASQNVVSQNIPGHLLLSSPLLTQALAPQACISNPSSGLTSAMNMDSMPAASLSGFRNFEVSQQSYHQTPAVYSYPHLRVINHPISMTQLSNQNSLGYNFGLVPSAPTITAAHANVVGGSSSNPVLASQSEECDDGISNIVISSVVSLSNVEDSDIAHVEMNTTDFSECNIRETETQEQEAEIKHENQDNGNNVKNKTAKLLENKANNFDYLCIHKGFYLCLDCKMKWCDECLFFKHIWEKHAHSEGFQCCPSGYSLKCENLIHILKKLYLHCQESLSEAARIHLQFPPLNPPQTGSTRPSHVQLAANTTESSHVPDLRLPDQINQNTPSPVSTTAVCSRTMSPAYQSSRSTTDSPFSSNNSEAFFYQCGFHNCLFSSLQPVDLLIHSEEKHGSELTFPCLYCGYLGQTGSLLLDHMSQHIGLDDDSVFACSMLENSLVLANYARQDVKLVTAGFEEIMSKKADISQIRFICNTCQTQFEKLIDLKEHLHNFLLKVIKCKHCRSYFLNSISWQKHQAQEHPNEPRLYCINRKLLCDDRKKYKEDFKQISDRRILFRRMSNFEKDVALASNGEREELPSQRAMDPSNTCEDKEVPQSLANVHNESAESRAVSEPPVNETSRPECVDSLPANGIEPKQLFQLKDDEPCKAENEESSNAQSTESLQSDAGEQLQPRASKAPNNRPSHAMCSEQSHPDGSEQYVLSQSPVCEDTGRIQSPSCGDTGRTESPVCEDTGRIQSPSCEDTRLPQLPVCEDTAHIHSPVCEDTGPTESPVCKDTGRTESPSCEDTRRTESPVSEDTGHTESPVCEDTGHTESPVCEDTGHTESPVCEDTGHTESPVCEDTGRIPSPSCEDTRRTESPVGEDTGRTESPVCEDTGRTESPVCEDTGRTESPVCVDTGQPQSSVFEDTRCLQSPVCEDSGLSQSPACEDRGLAQPHRSDHHSLVQDTFDSLDHTEQHDMFKSELSVSTPNSNLALLESETSISMKEVSPSVANASVAHEKFNSTENKSHTSCRTDLLKNPADIAVEAESSPINNSQTFNTVTHISSTGSATIKDLHENVMTNCAEKFPQLEDNNLTELCHDVSENTLLPRETSSQHNDTHATNTSTPIYKKLLHVLDNPKLCPLLEPLYDKSVASYTCKKCQKHFNQLKRIHSHVFLCLGKMGVTFCPVCLFQGENMSLTVKHKEKAHPDENSKFIGYRNIKIAELIEKLSSNTVTTETFVDLCAPFLLSDQTLLSGRGSNLQADPTSQLLNQGPSTPTNSQEPPTLTTHSQESFSSTPSKALNQESTPPASHSAFVYDSVTSEEKKVHTHEKDVKTSTSQVEQPYSSTGKHKVVALHSNNLKEKPVDGIVDATPVSTNNKRSSETEASEKIVTKKRKKSPPGEKNSITCHSVENATNQSNPADSISLYEKVSTAKSYTCTHPKCGFITTWDEAAMLLHWEKTHLHLQCGYCKAVYFNKLHLDNHLKFVHRGMEPKVLHFLELKFMFKEISDSSDESDVVEDDPVESIVEDIDIPKQEVSDEEYPNHSQAKYRKCSSSSDAVKPSLSEEVTQICGAVNSNNTSMPTKLKESKKEKNGSDKSPNVFNSSNKNQTSVCAQRIRKFYKKRNISQHTNNLNEDDKFSPSEMVTTHMFSYPEETSDTDFINQDITIADAPVASASVGVSSPPKCHFSRSGQLLPVSHGTSKTDAVQSSLPVLNDKTRIKGEGKSSLRLPDVVTSSYDAMLLSDAAARKIDAIATHPSSSLSDGTSGKNGATHPLSLSNANVDKTTHPSSLSDATVDKQTRPSSPLSAATAGLNTATRPSSLSDLTSGKNAATHPSSLSDVTVSKNAAIHSSSLSDATAGKNAAIHSSSLSDATAGKNGATHPSSLSDATAGKNGATHPSSLSDATTSKNDVKTVTAPTVKRKKPSTSSFPFKCWMCIGVYMKSVKDMEDHFKWIHQKEQAKFIDRRCGLLFSCDGELQGGDNDSLLFSETHLCKYCPLRSGSRSDVEAHIRIEHPLCSLVVISLKNPALRLVNTDSAETSENVAVKVAAAAKSILSFYDCNICGEVLNSEFFFRLHLAKHECFKHLTVLNSTDGLLVCPTCAYIASSNSDMAQHTGTHLDERRYKCSHCNTDSHQRCGINAHIKKCHPGDDKVTVIDRNKQINFLRLKPTLVNLDPKVKLVNPFRQHPNYLMNLLVENGIKVLDVSVDICTTILANNNDEKYFCVKPIN
ncbi:uncharacterized protein LOC131927846 isoform X2 [Physella acuta]|uniref:uncharacterized protein LOC131927846 isoform X2 n=1 Tax=Physella acuta TaxID=109671 RepID=UPI0027DE10E4|nr:uncharacterized protein LOC131927846 isoform X2 [Physella acuta]